MYYVSTYIYFKYVEVFCKLHDGTAIIAVHVSKNSVFANTSLSGFTGLAGARHPAAAAKLVDQDTTAKFASVYSRNNYFY